MTERPPESGPDEGKQEPKLSRAEPQPEEPQPAAATPTNKPHRGLRLVSQEKEKLTLDQRRAELLKPADRLEEAWKEYVAELEEKETEYVRSIVMEGIADGIFDGRLKDKDASRQDIKEDIYEDWLDTLEEEMKQDMDDYIVAHLPRVSTILPELNLSFFASKIGELMERTEKMLAAPPKEGQRLGEKDFLAVNVLKGEMRILKQMFIDMVDQEARLKFDPLISRARGDVRMFLIEHINKAGSKSGLRSVSKIGDAESELKKAQDFLKGKLEVEPKFIFLPEITSKESKKLVLGQTDTKYSVEINLEGLNFLEDGKKLDEVQLATTAIHELIHTVSNKSSSGKLGLTEYKELFRGVVQGKEIYKANDYLNELATELLALEIASKYYKPDAPGTIVLDRPEKQEYQGYADMIRAFKALDEKYGDRVDELKDILVSVMVQGNYEELQSFLVQNEELFAEVREICARSATSSPKKKKK